LVQQYQFSFLPIVDPVGCKYIMTKNSPPFTSWNLVGITVSASSFRCRKSSEHELQNVSKQRDAAEIQRKSRKRMKPIPDLEKKNITLSTLLKINE
jgi:hypothetical protein